MSFNSGTCATTGGAETTNSTTSLLLGFSTSIDQCSVSYTARAGGGAVGLNGLLTIGGVPAPAIVNSTAQAQTIVTVNIGTPAGFAGGLIAVSLTAHLAGLMEAAVQAASPFSRSGAASLNAVASITGQNLANINVVGQAAVFTRAIASNKGPVSDVALTPNSITTPVISINPLLPIEVLFSLEGTLSAGLFNQGTGEFLLTALNSLSFGLTGPALNLPDGFTANSESGLIVDNVYQGQGAGGSTQVPEPSTLAILGLGLAGLGFLRRRRERAA